MKRKISWTRRCDDGVKREVRAEIMGDAIKWQFKRADQEHWDYDSKPVAEDWDELEDYLVRKSGRGKSLKRLEKFKRIRSREGG